MFPKLVVSKTLEPLPPAANDNLKAPIVVSILVEWEDAKNITRGFVSRIKDSANLSRERCEGIAHSSAYLRLPQLLKRAPRNKPLIVALQIARPSEGLMEEKPVATLPPDATPEDIANLTNKMHGEMRARLSGNYGRGPSPSPAPVKGVS
ncbi:MAG: hypothetical protein KGI37_06105 [Alphaproteobacteria bacterium]|nr:hypothetical protein [Alphaproteobacteria bacterium]